MENAEGFRSLLSPAGLSALCSSSALNHPCHCRLPALFSLAPRIPTITIKNRKESSYLLVYLGCVLTIYHVCIYLWVKIVSLVLFEAGGECFKNVVKLESAVISHCTEYSALSLVSPAIWFWFLPLQRFEMI